MNPQFVAWPACSLFTVCLKSLPWYGKITLHEITGLPSSVCVVCSAFINIFYFMQYLTQGTRTQMHFTASFVHNSVQAFG